MTSYPKVPTFKPVGPFSPIEKVAGCMAALGPNNKIVVSGTCVRIAPNLYLTARHVLTDFLDQFKHEGQDVEFTVWIIHVFDGPEYAIWEMESFWLSPHSDLAIFQTHPYNDTAGDQTIVHSVGLELAPPPIGSRVSAFGHHKAEGRITVNEVGSNHYEINTGKAASVGEVREIHNLRRDSFRLNFPCYRVNARFDGGMSGGPVFNDQGHLCGVVCSSLPPFGEDEEHCSYVASLWPLMGLTVDFDITGAKTISSSPLIELAREGLIHVYGLQKILVGSSDMLGFYNVTLAGE